MRTGKKCVDARTNWGRSAWVRRKLKFKLDKLQARVLDSSSRRVLLNCTRQWGKSSIAAAKAVSVARFQPGSLTLVINPTLRQSGEFMRRVEGFAAHLGGRLRRGGESEVSLELENGSRIVGLGGNSSTLRGFSGVALAIVDEAARINDDLYRSLRPTLGLSGGALWMLSTPFGKRGFFYDLWTSGDPKWLRVQVTATECRRIPEDFLREERHALGDRWYRQEYLCEFAELEEAIFDADLVRQAVRKDLKPLDLD